MAHQISYRAGERLFLNVTDRCTLDCRFCPRTSGTRRIRGWDLTLDHKPDAAELIESVPEPSRYREIVFSGLGEPTLRLNLVLEVAAHVKTNGGRVRVDTDGLANLVHDRDTLPAMAGLVDNLSVSLNAQDETVYERQCRPNLPGSFEAMTDYLRAARGHVPKVQATAIAGVPGVDIPACERLARDLGVDFRARRMRELP